ncbi:MAG: hypothetical protein ABSF45_03315, partial [Terriglobia bacterium]
MAGLRIAEINGLAVRIPRDLAVARCEKYALKFHFEAKADYYETLDLLFARAQRKVRSFPKIHRTLLT